MAIPKRNHVHFKTTNIYLISIIITLIWDQLSIKINNKSQIKETMQYINRYIIIYINIQVQSEN